MVGVRAIANVQKAGDVGSCTDLELLIQRIEAQRIECSVLRSILRCRQSKTGKDRDASGRSQTSASRKNHCCGVCSFQWLKMGCGRMLEELELPNRSGGKTHKTKGKLDHTRHPTITGAPYARLSCAQVQLRRTPCTATQVGI